jgi:hypothetical protein
VSASHAEARIEISDLSPWQLEAAISIVSAMFEEGFALVRMEAVLRVIGRGHALLPLASAYPDLTRRERFWAVSIVLATQMMFSEEEDDVVEFLFSYLEQPQAVTEVLTAWRLRFRPRLVVTKPDTRDC